MLSIETILLLFIIFLLGILLGYVKELIDARRYETTSSNNFTSASNDASSQFYSSSADCQYGSILDIFRDKNTDTMVEAFRVLATEKEKRRTQ